MGAKQIRCQLSDQAILLIRKNLSVKLKIMVLWQISESTLYRWLDNNNPMLTNIDTIELLKTETNLQEKDLLNTMVRTNSRKINNLHP